MSVIHRVCMKGNALYLAGSELPMGERFSRFFLRVLGDIFHVSYSLKSQKLIEKQNYNQHTYFCAHRLNTSNIIW